MKLLDVLLALVLSLRIHNCDDQLRFLGKRLQELIEADLSPDTQALRLAKMIQSSKNPRLLTEMILQGAE